MSRSWSFLLLLFVILFCAIATVFTLIYQRLGTVWDSSIPPNGGNTVDFWRLFYFSIVTQATVGYGDMAPREDAVFVSIVHILIATMFTALAFGIIVLKLTQRSHTLKFAPHACYYPGLHQLVFWVWNRDANALYNIEHTIGVEKPVEDNSGPGIRVIRYPLKVRRQQTFVPSMLGMMIGTSRDSIRDADLASPPCASSNDPNDVSMCTRDSQGVLLWTDSVISIEVRAKVAEFGTDVFARQSYSIDEVTCGRYKDLADGEFPKDWHYRLFERFGQIDPTQSDTCGTCSENNHCPLGAAKEYRRRAEQGQQTA